MERTPRHAEGVQAPRRPWVIIAMVLLLIGVTATAVRTVVRYQTPGPFTVDRQGYCDFHNGIYFPTLAFFRGTSPFGQDYADRYPVARQLPAYSPAILAFHGPLVLLPLRYAEVLYFILSVGTVGLVGGLIVVARDGSWRIEHVLALCVVIVFSRSGHVSLFNGYFTLELILATFAAIHFAGRRPWVSILALTLVATKPTFILPLGFLMAARGNVRELAWGAALSVITSGAAMLWLAWNSIPNDQGMLAGAEVIVEQLATSQEIHRNMPDETPATSWTRLDALAVYNKWSGQNPAEVAHLVVMAILLVPGMWLLDRRRRRGIDDGLTGVTGGIILTFTLASVYHQTYDALLLFPVAYAVVLGISGSRQWTSPARRLLVGGLLLFPAYNYLSTQSFLSILGDQEFIKLVLTSLNGVAVLVAAGVLVAMAGAQRSGETAHAATER